MADEDIRALASEKQMIQAIKLYRERYGVGLTEAKHAVEALLERGDVAARPVEPTISHAARRDEDIRVLAAQGKMIDAIKLYRQRYKVGLKQAKEAVEDLTGKRSSGCLTALTLVLALIALVAYH